MTIRVEFDDQASPALRNMAQRTLPRARQHLVQSAIRDALARVIERHPVETGRSSAAWSEALQQLGGRSPSSGRGSDPAAMAEGRSQGTGELTPGEDQTEATATNAVDYVRYLEYGTSRMAPFAMVRSALLGTASVLASLFSLADGQQGGEGSPPAR